MSWNVRHAGSPEAVRGLSREQVLQGIADGLWEPTDEVQTDAGQRWQSLESQPEFAEAVADFEPPPRVEPEDESRLDMNPMIDVSLVLLIFFILTATYETIRKVLDMPAATQSKLSSGMQKSAAEKLRELTIRVEARSEGGKSVIKVEDEVVKLAEVGERIGRLTKASGKKQVLLDAQGVDWGTVVAIMDAARATGVEKTLLATPPRQNQ